MREQPNFYWNQEDYLREKQRGKGWSFSIFPPSLIVGYSQGSPMNLIPAIGAYAAILKEAGQPLHYPDGPPRVGQAVDADLLARCMAWAGDATVARNETFNVADAVTSAAEFGALQRRESQRSGEIISTEASPSSCNCSTYHRGWTEYQAQYAPQHPECRLGSCNAARNAAAM
jgi:hypothetical protein